MPQLANRSRQDDPVREAAFDWLMRVRASPDDPALQADLETWLSAAPDRRAAYCSLERMLRVARRLPADYAAQVRAQPRRGIAGRQSVTPRRRRRLAVCAAGAALAACFVLAFLPTLRLHLQSDYVTGTGEIRTVALADGSRVHLDAATAIAIRYGPDRREIVLLDGQAFFEVAKAPDRPFVVASGAVRTTAIGTAFSVRSGPETISVALQSGVVNVRSGGPRGHTVTLAPGERLRVSRADGRFRRSRIFAETIAAWRERRLIVDSARLADVVRQLDSHYRGRILLRNAALANARVTGVFDLRHPIDALRAIVRTQQGSVIEVTPYLAVVSGP